MLLHLLPVPSTKTIQRVTRFGNGTTRGSASSCEEKQLWPLSGVPQPQIETEPSESGLTV